MIPVFIYLELKKRKFAIRWRDEDLLRKVFPKLDSFYIINVLLKSIVVFISILLIAGPGSYNVKQEESRNGIDIIFTLDISKSMVAEDMKPNRIEAAKNVINEFISKLKDDRIGMTIFAGKPFISIPLTFDYDTVSEIVKGINTDSINQNIPGLSGTAIGDALIQSCDSLTKIGSDEKRSKVIILITDGEANLGINPELAAKYASEKKIKIYSVGIGDPSGTLLFTTDKYGVKQYFLDNLGNPIKSGLDEKTLNYISANTGGKYYVAKDFNSLSKIFEDLSDLNKTDIKVTTIRNFDFDMKKYLNILVLSLLLLFILNIKYRFD
ncbi:MAG: VWA domain-containing protein [Candidatus Gracilibacteria bacterium]|nr:VWA domain-containing protein [Candidatus Gracilibacteria bacterium]